MQHFTSRPNNDSIQSSIHDAGLHGRYLFKPTALNTECAHQQQHQHRRPWGVVGRRSMAILSTPSVPFVFSEQTILAYNFRKYKIILILHQVRSLHPSIPLRLVEERHHLGRIVQSKHHDANILLLHPNVKPFPFTGEQSMEGNERGTNKTR